MRGCPACGRLYPDHAAFCPVDGAALTSASEAPIVPDAGDRRLGQLVAERYELRRVVADGATGRIYEALDRLDRVSVAVKIMHESAARDEVAVERFRREFQVNELLPRDHVVRVLDFAPTHDGSFALVMEFLYGEELSAALRRQGRLSPARTVRLMSQLALALDKAHANKLVHRDLKPDNLFLCQTSEGEGLKILDFGSVKDKKRRAKNLTVMGTTIGSPFYMAPEQAQGLPSLDHRADVWAAAAIAFECITGSVPFPGETSTEILVRIMRAEAPAPSSVALERGLSTPEALDAVFARAFRKTPDYRQGSVGELADELGVAFGLRGVHAQWATTSEVELASRIEQASQHHASISVPAQISSAAEREAQASVDDVSGQGAAPRPPVSGSAAPDTGLDQGVVRPSAALTSTRGLALLLVAAVLLSILAFALALGGGG